MKKIALIGATGSVGQKVVSLAKRRGGDFKIAVAVAGRESRELSAIGESTGARIFSACEDKQGALDAVCEPDIDLVFNAASGFAGLEYSLRAVGAKKPLALANKETLVCGGDILIAAAEREGVDVLPVDSEHSAIWQCLGFDRHAPFSHLYLTASGGPFYGYDKKRLEKVTPAEACAHPVWKMGKKISIDSATMLNKGFEIIEAHHLFGADYDNISAVIHPQGIVHSFVGFSDGSIIAEAAAPSMELPVQIALYFPKRVEAGAPKLDFARLMPLEFLPLDPEKFPAFSLAVECGRAGGILPCALNAASEVADGAFLSGRISFSDIYKILEKTVSSTKNRRAENFSDLCEADAEARRAATTFL